MLQVMSFDEQPYREQQLRDRPLADVEPPRPTIENQSPHKKQIQKHCWCGPKKISSQSILEAQSIEWHRKKMPRFDERIFILSPDPLAKRFAIVMIDFAG